MRYEQPGESFKENIEAILDDCKLFTLLVTPQLLEKVVDENGEERDNYVVSTELPLARKKKEEKGTDIFPVEMEKTDRESLSAIDINDYVYFKDKEFRSRLLRSISKIAISENNNEPEHNFLIGLAYLEGIDVEVDSARGLALITSAAEAGLLEAMEKLYSMYNTGTGTKLDYREAVKWAERLADHLQKTLGEDHPDTLTALGNLAFDYKALGKFKKVLPLLENCIHKE